MRIGAIIALILGIILIAGTFVLTNNNPNLSSKLSVIMNDVDFFAMYQNAANPYIRYVQIPAGLRKEQVVDIYSKTLAWNDQDKKDFLAVDEGYYFPSTYVLPVDASGEMVKDKMLETFNKNVDEATTNKKYKIDKNKVSMDTILKIASLIQREAGKSDKNLVSGIIWNRIWSGMSLDLDATLQYAKGDPGDWWPTVKSKDKYINSPYNTYMNAGLPPTPISSPNLASIEAAYNPQQTSCLFYFHDNNHIIHCSRTYAEHLAGINKYLN